MCRSRHNISHGLSVFSNCAGVNFTANPVVVSAEELRSCNGIFNVTVTATVASTYNATAYNATTYVTVPAGRAIGTVPGAARVFAFEGANILWRLKVRNT